MFFVFFHAIHYKIIQKKLKNNLNGIEKKGIEKKGIEKQKLENKIRREESD